MRKYMHVVVFRKDGTTFENPLMMSEIRLLKVLMNEHDHVEVRTVECTKERYKAIFGV